MPREIQMDQNLDDDNQMILDDPFIGADVDEELENDDADYGNEVDAAASDDDTPEETPANDAADDDAPAEDDADADDDAADDADDTPADDDEPAADDDSDEEEEEDEPAGDPPPKEQRIPKQRFDEVNDRRKAAEKKLADYEAAQDAAKAAEEGQFDFDAKEREYMELTVDGEFDKALAIRSEIRAAESAKYEQTATTAAANAREATKADLVFQETVTDLEAKYPSMAPNGENFDQTLVDEVLSLHEGFINQGLDAPAAITKAVKYVAKMNDIPAVGDEPAADPDPTPKPKPVSKTDNKAKAKAKTTQPQQLPKASDREPAMDMDSMSEEDFDALPESKKRELRGDFV